MLLIYNPTNDQAFNCLVTGPKIAFIPTMG
jgi:hypothetical protein